MLLHDAARFFGLTIDEGSPKRILWKLGVDWDSTAAPSCIPAPRPASRNRSGTPPSPEPHAPFTLWFPLCPLWYILWNSCRERRKSKEEEATPSPHSPSRTALVAQKPAPAAPSPGCAGKSLG
jgi:hypothetical protein